jgi:hypothetical protein
MIGRIGQFSGLADLKAAPKINQLKIKMSNLFNKRSWAGQEIS